MEEEIARSKMFYLANVSELENKIPQYKGWVLMDFTL